MLNRSGRHAISAQAMDRLRADTNGGATLDDRELDEIADRLEDHLDTGDLAEPLHELASLAAHLRNRGLDRAADRLARVVAGFAGAVAELIDDEKESGPG